MLKLPFNVDIHNLISDLKIISWQAYDILQHYSNEIKDNNKNEELIKYKYADDPVTIADLKVNNLVISEIHKRYPNINWGFLSEEKGELNINNADSSFDWLWVLDPLDGTRDFINHTGEYAMHLALNYKNIPILGIVLIPSKEELWIADGTSVWSEKRDGYKQKPFQTSRKDIKDMIVVTSKNHKNNELNFLIKKLGFSRNLSMGSIGFKITSILRGDSDVYISLSLPGKSSPKDWDFAAPQALLTTGEGSITNYQNKKLIYNKEGLNQSGLIIATNNLYNHENLCHEVEKIIVENSII